jgi:hypothetical protein
MALMSETTEGLLHISDFQIQAIVRHARYKAQLTAFVLNTMGLLPTKPYCVPGMYLLELAAVLELGMWERQGLRQFLDTDLPTFDEAAAELARRANLGPDEFRGPDAAPLNQRVLKVWLENFAWNPGELSAPSLLVGQIDEDCLVDTLAEFIWNNRNNLSQILAQNREFDAGEEQ